MNEERKIQLVAEVDATGTRAGFAEIGQQANTMAAAVTRSGNEAQRAVAGIGNGADSSAQKVESAQRNLIGSIQRTTAAMESGSRSSSQYYETLARQRGVDPATLAPYLAQLRAVEAAQTRGASAAGVASQSLDRVGISAKQTANALRGVPAQFTDIVTSIQGGQAPLTVFLQQGGQLKDMFGGAGAAARALGGYVLGLINPLTVGAAAAVALAVAYNQGAGEAKEYAKALILSGNAAGTSAGKLQDMARSISATIGTQGAAAEALAELAGTGRVAAANLQEFATTAIKAQRALGQSVADTAKEFADLGRTPLASLEKLNDKYHFLTAAVYEQVKALQDQGRASEAAEVAQKAYSASFDGISTQVTANLGLIERAWIGVKDKAKSGWDAILDIGRADTDKEKLERLNTMIANRRGNLVDRRARTGVQDDDITRQGEKELQVLLDRQDLLMSGAREEAKANDVKANSVKLEEARIKWLKEGDQFLSKSEQRERAITVARNEGIAAGKSQEEIEKRVGEIRKKFAGESNDGVDARIEKIKSAAKVEDEIGRRSLEQLASNRRAGAITEEQYIAEIGALQARGFDRQIKSLEQELIIAKTKKNSLKEQAKLESDIQLVKEKRISAEADLTNQLVELEVKRTRLAAENYAKVVEGAEKERDKYQGQLQAQDDYNERLGLTKREIAALEVARLESNAAIKEENALLLEAADSSDRLAVLYRQQAEALRSRAASIRSGAAKEETVKQNEEYISEWKKTQDKYNDVFRTGFADMLNNGRDGWKSFTRSLVTTFKTTVADQIYKMFAQPFVMKLVASLIGTTGLSGVSSVANAATGQGGGLGSTVSALQTGKTLWEGFSSGFNSSVGGSISTIGDLFGSSSISAFGSGVSGGASTASAASAYAASGNTAVASSLNAGATIAPYIPVVAAFVASYFGAKAIAGQYRVEGVGNALNFLGLGGGVINRAFGMGNKELQSTTLSGQFGDNGFNGNTVQDFLQKGGWFRSDKRTQTSTAVDGALGKQLGGAYDAIKAASADFAKTLGINADSIATRAQSLSIALTKDQAANEKAIADFFLGVGDTIAKELLPTIADFAKEGESASGALQRIATNYAFVDAALNALGLSFGAVGVDSISARERLVELSGGLESFGKGAAYFAQNFLSEAERLAPVAKTVEAALAALDLSDIKTRDQFKETVLALDLTTESGAKTYASLIGIAEKFALLHPVVDQVAVAVEDTTTAMVDAVAAAKEAQAKILSSVGNSVADSLTRTIEAAKNLRAYSDSLLTGSLSALDAEERYQAAKKQFIASKPGDTEAASTYLQAAKDRDAGDFSYSRDFAAVMEKTKSGAIALDQQAAGIIRLYQSFVANPSGNPPAIVTPAAINSPQQQTQTEQTAIVKELQLMRETFAQALAPVAVSTAATADVLDRVTAGGSVMLTEAA